MRERSCLRNEVLYVREGKNRGWGGEERRGRTPPALSVRRTCPRFLLSACCISSNPLVHTCHCLDQPVPEPLSSLRAPPGYKPAYKLNSPLKRKPPKRHFPSLPCGHCTDTRRKPVQSVQPALDTIPKAVTSWIRGRKDAVWPGHGRAATGSVGWWLIPAPGPAALGEPLATCAHCRGGVWLRRVLHGVQTGPPSLIPKLSWRFCDQSKSFN